MKKFKNIDDLVSYCLKNLTEEEMTEFYKLLIEFDKQNHVKKREKSVRNGQV